MFKSTVFLTYLGWLVAGILFFVCQSYKVTPLTLTFIILFFVLLPGFGFSRLTKLRLGQDMLSQIVTWLAFGLVIILFLSCLTLVFGWTIQLLISVISVLSVGLFVAGFILDWRRKTFYEKDWQWRYLIPDFWTVLILLLSILMLTVLSFKGSIMKGGAPLFHIATMLKAVSGGPLTLHNIAYQPDIVNIAYLFPIWHVFLGICAKLSHLDVFTLWQRAVLPLTAMSYLIWAWLIRRILPTRHIQSLGIILFLILSFIWEDGYTFTGIAIPNTFSEQALLPLAVGVTLNYILLPKKEGIWKKSWPWVVFMIPFSIVLALVHPQGYVYYLFILGSFLIFWLILSFRDPEFKPILKRIFLAFAGFIIAFLPLVVVWQIFGQKTFSQTLANFYQNSMPQQVRFIRVVSWGLTMKYAFILLPLVLLFLKKYRALVLPLATVTMIPIVSMDLIRPLVLKTVSYLWLRRLPTNVFWYFLIWGLVIGFVFLLLDRFIRRFNKALQIIFSILAALLVVLVFWLQQKFNFTLKANDFIFGSTTNSWANHNYLWIVITLAILAIFGFILMHFRQKIADFFTLEEPKNQLVQIFLVIALGLILVAPSYAALAKAPISRLEKPIKRNQNQDYIKYYVGGDQVIDYIKSNISPNAVFDCYNCYFYLLPLVDVKMPIFADDADDLYVAIYNTKLPMKDRIRLIDHAKMQYLLLSDDPKKLPRLETDFDQYPQYFTKIFVKKPVPKERAAVIYKVNRDRIKLDMSKP